MGISMKNWKEISKKLIFLPVWLVMLLTVLCAAALAAIFLNDRETEPIAYAVYAASFYMLTVLCIACVKTIPEYYRNVRVKVYENPYANRYLTDVFYKTHVNLYTSLAVNLLYVAANAVSAVLYRTHWFAVFAVYYGIMAVMRFLLVRYVNRNNIGESLFGELKRARACACILLTVNITLSAVVLMMVYYNKGFNYHGYLIYVMALYTFYTTTMAVIDVIKYRKYNSPIMSVTKIIRLASSLFSMLFLETAMFAQFGQETPESTKRIMLMATGAGISVLVVGMSVYMIWRTSKQLRQRRRNGD